jgi:hypothetical protein
MRIRRLPPPGRVAEQAARFVVRDANGQAHWPFFEKGQDAGPDVDQPSDAEQG